MRQGFRIAAGVRTGKQGLTGRKARADNEDYKPAAKHCESCLDAWGAEATRIRGGQHCIACAHAAVAAAECVRALGVRRRSGRLKSSSSGVRGPGALTTCASHAMHACPYPHTQSCPSSRSPRTQPGPLPESAAAAGDALPGAWHARRCQDFGLTGEALPGAFGTRGPQLLRRPRAPSQAPPLNTCRSYRCLPAARRGWPPPPSPHPQSQCRRQT